MTAGNQITVEIAVHTIDSALAAEAGGAHRIELFSNPIEGGVTPSEGLIAAVRENVTKPVHVMIRPRGGDFHYSNLEFDVMGRDINMAKRLGAHGVVFGLLNQDGTVDMDRTRQLVETARPLAVTFHRAIDLCCDLEKAVDGAGLLRSRSCAYVGRGGDRRRGDELHCKACVYRCRQDYDDCRRWN